MSRNPDERTRQTHHSEPLPWRLGAKAGGVAFGIVYVVMYAVTIASDIDPVFFDRWGQHNAAAWLAYSAHNVKIAASGAASSIGSVNFIQSNTDAFPLPTILLYAIPAAVLFLAGRYVASHSGTLESSPDRAAKEGATVVAGYLALAVLGAFVFTGNYSEATLKPDFVETVVMMGLAYPVVLGAAGGWVWKNGATNRQPRARHEGKRP
ncbi:MAG: hypothetical protein ABEJ90_01715 [Halobacterium sp.]